MKKQRQHHSLDGQRFSHLLARCGSVRDALLLRILFETGCGVAELASLRVRDLSPGSDASHSPTISFSDPARASVISPSLSSAFNDFLVTQERRPSEFAFSQQPQKPFSVKRIEQVIAQLDKALTPQDIRYLHISHAASRGLTPDAIAAQTGLGRQRVLQILDDSGVAYSQSYSMFFENLGGNP